MPRPGAAPAVRARVPGGRSVQPLGRVTLSAGVATFPFDADDETLAAARRRREALRSQASRTEPGAARTTAVEIAPEVASCVPARGRSVRCFLAHRRCSTLPPRMGAQARCPFSSSLVSALPLLSAQAMARRTPWSCSRPPPPFAPGQNWERRAHSLRASSRTARCSWAARRPVLSGPVGQGRGQGPARAPRRGPQAPRAGVGACPSARASRRSASASTKGKPLDSA